MLLSNENFLFFVGGLIRGLNENIISKFRTYKRTETLTISDRKFQSIVFGEDYFNKM